MKSDFFKVGRLPTLIACFLYFDASFTISALFGHLAILIAPDLHLNLGEKGNDGNDRGGHLRARPLGCYRHAFVIGLALLGSGEIALAADALPQPQTTESSDVAQDVANYFADWFKRVDATSADQPSWAAPMTTPRRCSKNS